MPERRMPRRSVVRMCVGCRVRADKSNLLRVVVVGGERTLKLVPDPRGRLPGRGAYVHPDPQCVDLAERRRAFSRALRVREALDTTAVRTWIDDYRNRQAAEPAGSGGEAGRPTRGDGS